MSVDRSNGVTAEEWFTGRRRGPASEQSLRQAGGMKTLDDWCEAISEAPWESWWTTVRANETGDALTALKRKLVGSVLVAGEPSVDYLWRDYVRAPCQCGLPLGPSSTARANNPFEDPNVLILAEGAGAYRQIMEAKALLEVSESQFCTCTHRNLTWVGETSSKPTLEERREHVSWWLIGVVLTLILLYLLAVAIDDHFL